MRILKGLVKTGRNQCVNKNYTVIGPQRLQRLTDVFASFPPVHYPGDIAIFVTKAQTLQSRRASTQHYLLLCPPRRREASPSAGAQAGACCTLMCICPGGSSPSRTPQEPMVITRDFAAQFAKEFLRAKTNLRSKRDLKLLFSHRFPKY